MDFLDPQKRRRHAIMLMLGYALIAVAILGITFVLLTLTYGFSRGKNGRIIQNGLVYLSSQPNPAKIYLNGTLSKSQTNTRLLLPQGRYTVKLTRSGYRDWQRSVTVLGGDVQHFDYPVLFPTTLTTSIMHNYTAAPGLATQSLDRRWLLIQVPGSSTNFDLYDLKNPAKAATAIALPANLVSGGNNQNWQFIEWADDNQHVLLEHLHDNTPEFIVVDRANPDQSVNLNKTLNVNPSAVTLNNEKYDQYYLYFADQHTLETAALKNPTAAPYLDHVLTYKSYSDNTMLYASNADVPAGKVAIRMQVGDKNYLLRQIPAGNTYLLDLTQYSGTLYCVVTSPAENKVYIYKDPIGEINAQPNATPSPIRALRISNPTYMSFSANTQFILVEAGVTATTYDFENSKSYAYTLPQPLDQPQTHVSWMDGDRLTYVAGGKLEVVDYDDTNPQSLMPALPAYLPFFAPDYKRAFALAPAAQPNVNLTLTPLLTPADL